MGGGQLPQFPPIKYAIVSDITIILKAVSEGVYEISLTLYKCFKSFLTPTY